MPRATVSQVSGPLQLKMLARDTGVAIIIQVIGLVLIYLTRVYLARWMGETEYGIYEYVISWSLLLATFSGLGFPRAVLRFVAQYRVKEKWALLLGIVRTSWLLTLGVSLIFSLVGTGVVTLVDRAHPFVYAKPLLVGIWLVPLQALMNLQREMSRAFDDITLALTPLLVIWPALVLGGGIWWLDRHKSLTSLPMVTLATLLLLGVLIFQVILMAQKIRRDIGPQFLATAVSVPTFSDVSLGLGLGSDGTITLGSTGGVTQPEQPKTPKPRLEYAYKEWLSVSVVLLLQNAFGILLQQTDIVMVGSLLGPEDAGLYGAAVKTSLWVGFVLQTVNIVAAPAFATLYAQKDMQGLQRLVGTVTIWIFWPSLAIAIGLMSFAPEVMSWFGPQFVAGALELKILVVGQVVSALCGSVAYLMSMTGHQNRSVVVFGSAAVLNIVLNAVLIPWVGAMGAAIATGFTMVVWNVWLSVLVVKYVKIQPSVFYFLFQGKETLKAPETGTEAAQTGSETGSGANAEGESGVTAESGPEAGADADPATSTEGEPDVSSDQS
ncbi:MAG: flippase [Prochlorothrix sp.]|nr:flippase [Prochlorothrix sp.]